MASITELAGRTRLPVAEIVRRLCEFAFSKTRMAGDISCLFEPAQTAIQENAHSYMPQHGQVIGAKIKSPIAETIDLDATAPLKAQNERRKKAQQHKAQPA